MSTIFVFSSQPQEETMKTSNFIVKTIENNAKLNDKTEFKNENEQRSYWRRYEMKLIKVVRKGAHVFLFSILSLCLFLMFKSFDVNDADAIIFVLSICVIYAGLDEWHQSFVEGRNSLFIDVCVDTFGAATSVILVMYIKKIKSVIKSNKYKES